MFQKVGCRATSCSAAFSLISTKPLVWIEDLILALWLWISLNDDLCHRLASYLMFPMMYTLKTALRETNQSLEKEGDGMQRRSHTWPFIPVSVTEGKCIEIVGECLVPSEEVWGFLRMYEGVTKRTHHYSSHFVFQPLPLLLFLYFLIIILLLPLLPSSDLHASPPVTGGAEQAKSQSVAAALATERESQTQAVSMETISPCCKKATHIPSHTPPPATLPRPASLLSETEAASKDASSAMSGAVVGGVEDDKDRIVVEIMQMYSRQQEKLNSTLQKQQQLEMVSWSMETEMSPRWSRLAVDIKASLMQRWHQPTAPLVTLNISCIRKYCFNIYPIISFSIFFQIFLLFKLFPYFFPVWNINFKVFNRIFLYSEAKQVFNMDTVFKVSFIKTLKGGGYLRNQPVLRLFALFPRLLCVYFKQPT